MYASNYTLRTQQLKNILAGGWGYAAAEIAISRFLTGELPAFSTGVCGAPTGGYGEVCDNGYFEYPLPPAMVNFLLDIKD